MELRKVMKPRVEKKPETKAPKTRSTYPARGTRPVKAKGETSVTEGVENVPRSSKPSQEKKPTVSQPTKEEITARAHAIWEREGRPNGCETEHWLRAEAELRLERKLMK
jgi:hypothetical protein